MPDVTASRTLVKSAPELWTECSDADSLGRHLDQFGDIRITRLEPETAVAWEGELASGTVRLEPSGWGTRVVLTATPAPSAHGTVTAAEPPEAGVPVVCAPPPAPSELAEAPEARATSEPEAIASEPDLEPTPVARPEPALRPGLFARLLGRFRSQPQPVAEAEPAQRPRPAVVGPEPVGPAPAPSPSPVLVAPDPLTTPEPAAGQPPGEPGGERPPDPEAILVAALDSLGQAHHRPYSRA